MEREGLTPSKFAETIGIQRSAMSHIISGRNNPSLDVLVKILETFTYIDSDWLLFGKGNMTRANEGATPERDLFTQNPIIPSTPSVISEYRRENIVETPRKEDKSPVPDVVITVEKPSRNVNKIMIFYSDNTFDTFVLERD